MRRLLPPVILLAALTLAATAAPVTAGPSTGSDTAGFSAPVRVKAGSYSDMAMVVDSNGRLHMALIDPEGVWYLTNRGGNWRSRIVLVHPTNKDYHSPAIALDENDRITIALGRTLCDDCTPGAEDGVFMVSDHGRARGTFPTSPVRIAPVNTTAPSVKTVGGRLYVAYAVCLCQPKQATARVSVGIRNAAGVWTRSKLTDYGWDPSLRVAANGRARVAFGSPEGIRYASAGSTTGSFTLVDVPGTEGQGGGSPSLALDSADRPHIAWLRGDDPKVGSLVLHARRTAAGWTAPRPASSGTFSELSLSIDGADRPHILAGGLGIVEAVLRAGEWREKPIDPDVRVAGLSLRASSSGTIAAWAGRSPTDPRGIYVSRD